MKKQYLSDSDKLGFEPVVKLKSASFKARRVVVDADTGLLIAYPCDDTLPSVCVELRDENMARGIIEELQEFIRCNPSNERLAFESEQQDVEPGEYINRDNQD